MAFLCQCGVFMVDACFGFVVHHIPCLVLCDLKLGVYKQWTGLLEWWNSGMVDWIVFVLIFIVYHIISTLLCFHLTS